MVNINSYRYKAIPGFFIQDDPHALASSIGPAPPRFGLVDETPERWNAFRSKISKLNDEAPGSISYKVIFFGRHGEGFHNVAEAKYGTKAWDDYWSKLNGDSELTWGPDPDLTKLGESQAALAHALWETELPFDVPLPEQLYSSPLTRAMNTNIITFKGIINENHRTIVLENCREENGEHTCDKRMSRSYIASSFSRFEIEDGFSEEDELWDPKVRESKAHVALRAKAVLDRIFSGDSETYISITAHGGIINAFLNVMGRPSYALPTGGVIPIVVQAINEE